MTRRTKTVLWVIRIIVGVLFIISGFVKANDISGFAYKLNDYWDVFGVPFLKFSSLFLAWFLSVFEIAVAIALIVGYRMRITAWVLLLMILFFTLLTGFSAITGAVQDCGCFGEAIKLTPWESFGKDVILMLLIFPIWRNRNKIKPFRKGFIPALATLLAFVGFGYWSYYSYSHLPSIDFISAYKIGADLQYNATTIDPEKENYIAHDFSEFCEACGNAGNGFDGGTLYIVMYNLEKSCNQALEDVVTLTNSLKKEMPDLKICAGTNSASKTRKAYAYEYGMDFCIAPRDEKMLKTMIRSSPGYIVLKDGFIKGKWHHNDLPSIEQIKEALK